MRILEEAVGQLLALLAFIAFPATQYLGLKWLIRKEGQPELWYLPDYGFRLVVRNLPRKKCLRILAMNLPKTLRSVLCIGSLPLARTTSHWQRIGSIPWN